MGIRAMKGQSTDLQNFASRVSGQSDELDAAIVAAREATDAFIDWLENEADSKTGPSGVGADNYTWYLQNVHLVPYTWEQQETLMLRELVRSHGPCGSKRTATASCRSRPASRAPKRTTAASTMR